MSDARTAESLNISPEDFDILGEDLTFLISPKLSARSDHSNLSETSNAASLSNSNSKVSPIVTDDTQLGSMRPALGSLRGYDANNNPVYASSQTPHDYQVMTKRKVSKKSIFNFDEVDLKPNEGSAHSSTSGTTTNSHSFNVPKTTDGIAFPPGTTQAVRTDIFVKTEPSESLDETKFTFDLSNDSVPQFLEGINWNSQNSQMSEELNYLANNQLYPANEEFTKNPRKKQVADLAVADNPGPRATNYSIPEPQMMNPGGYMANSNDYHLSHYPQPTTTANPWTVDPHHHHQQHQQQYHHPHSQPPQYINEGPTVFTVPYLTEPLPSIRTLQENSPALQQYPFPTPIITTNTPPTSSSTNPHDYETFSNFSSPDHHSHSHVSSDPYYLPSSNNSSMSRSNPNPHPSSSSSSSTMHDLHTNYHTILQQKVEAMKLSQSPNAWASTSHRQQQKLTPIIHTSGGATHQQQQQVYTPDDESGKGSMKNRASKSLAEISRRFVTLYGKDNTMDYISGLVDPDIITDPTPVLNRVDGAADALGVHVRRIYELIKILEILSLVAFAGDKRGKFSWRGTKNFLLTLGSIQNDGLTRFPQIAREIGLLDIHLPEDEQRGFGETEKDEEELVDVEEVEEEEEEADGEGRRHKTSGLHASESREDFLVRAASVDGHELNESSWNDLNQLLTESSLFDLENDVQPLDLFTVEEEEEEATRQSRRQPIKNSNTNHTTTRSKPTLQLRPPPQSSPPTAKAATPVVTPNEEHFMVEIICKRFLQLFLVGMNHLSMGNVIQKLIPMEKHQTLSEYNKVNATKIRRVYDVTNVLCSLNLIQKISIPKAKALKAEIFNNMDDILVSNIGGSPAQHSDIDSHDCDEDSKASGSKKSSKGSTRSSGERGETKVLEWSSFSPHIIRLKYLERKKQILLQHQQQQEQLQQQQR